MAMLIKKEGQPHGKHLLCVPEKGNDRKCCGGEVTVRASPLMAWLNQKLCREVTQCLVQNEMRYHTHQSPDNICRLHHGKGASSQTPSKIDIPIQWPKTLISSHSHQPSSSEKCSTCWQSHTKDPSQLQCNHHLLWLSLSCKTYYFQNDFVENFPWTRSQWKKGTWKKCAKQVWHWNIISSSFSHLTNNKKRTLLLLVKYEIWHTDRVGLLL